MCCYLCPSYMMNMGALALFVSSFVTRPRWVNVASFLIFALAVVMQTMFAATVRPGCLLLLWGWEKPLVLFLCVWDFVVPWSGISIVFSPDALCAPYQ